MAAGDITAVRSKASDVYSAASFDGVDDNIITNIKINKLGTEFSFSFWVNNILSDGDYRNVFYSTDWYDFGNFVFYTINNVWEFGIKDASSDISANPTISLNAWHHLVFRISTTNVKIYVDGVQSTSNNLAAPFQVKANVGIVLGGSTTGLKGFLKDFRIYNKALSTTEISTLYSGLDIDRSNLIGEWKLQTDYLDTSGNGTNATNQGTFLTNTLTNKIKADMTGLNLGAATDKIIALPRRGSPTIVTANRAAA